MQGVGRWIAQIYGEPAMMIAPFDGTSRFAKAVRQVGPYAVLLVPGGSLILMLMFAWSLRRRPWLALWDALWDALRGIRLRTEEQHDVGPLHARSR
jgi:hypothetical protein